MRMCVFAGTAHDIISDYTQGCLNQVSTTELLSSTVLTGKNCFAESPKFSFGVAGSNFSDFNGEITFENEAVEITQLQSDSSVAQPNPFRSMLSHLRGPQYVSPAPIIRPTSPHSPDDCKPVIFLPNDGRTSAGEPSLSQISVLSI